MTIEELKRLAERPTYRPDGPQPSQEQFKVTVRKKGCIPCVPVKIAFTKKVE